MKKLQCFAPLREKGRERDREREREKYRVENGMRHLYVYKMESADSWLKSE